MKLLGVSVMVLCLGVLVVTSGAQSDTDRDALRRSLPLVSDLPSTYRSVGALGSHGEFYAAGTSRHRVDDGDAYHGMPATVAWAADLKTAQELTQGVHYGVEDGRIVSAGYLIRQADLVAGNSFHGLTLRELDFPAAHSITLELLEDDTDAGNRYLLLWRFLPEVEQVRPMLRRGELQPLTSLPPRFSVVPNEAYTDDFYPRMGRHRRVSAESRTRRPTGTGAESVWYGEAAGQLIFIEYIFRQQDFVDGASWVELPLNGIPIPPIDNVHILHYNGAQPGGPGTYTVHMYFVPEDEFLSWETEPRVVEGPTQE